MGKRPTENVGTGNLGKADASLSAQFSSSLATIMAKGSFSTQAEANAWGIRDGQIDDSHMPEE